jgi:hypothetical protein
MLGRGSRIRASHSLRGHHVEGVNPSLRGWGTVCSSCLSCCCVMQWRHGSRRDRELANELSSDDDGWRRTMLFIVDCCRFGLAFNSRATAGFFVCQCFVTYFRYVFSTYVVSANVSWRIFVTCFVRTLFLFFSIGWCDVRVLKDDVGKFLSFRNVHFSRKCGISIFLRVSATWRHHLQFLKFGNVAGRN